MATPNDPDFRAQSAELARYFRRAIRDIIAELNRLSLTDMQRAQILAALKSISGILAQLNDDAQQWVEENVPVAARQGVIDAILALGVVETVAEAEKIVKFNRANQAVIQAAIEDTQADLLAVTQNVERKVRSAVRQAAADAMRSNMAKGVNGVKTIRGDLLENIRKKLGDAANSGIIDAAGRRWKPDVYADMVARTKLSRVYMDATANEAVQRGALYGVISRHGATDGCGPWEGRIVKLTPDAPGNYPLLSSLYGGAHGIFHQ
ncbi:MAG: minor capsid protein [Acidobacterium ailaaui]|nr:minor capsid protein [Pseudacidobacterium ailaaui]